jgi:hypothetical protein
LFVQYGFVTWKKAHYFEASAGPNFTGGGDFTAPVPFGLGYRHQKPGKPFIFRTGIASQETIHFGMGLSF